MTREHGQVSAADELSYLPPTSFNGDIRTILLWCGLLELVCNIGRVPLLLAHFTQYRHSFVWMLLVAVQYAAYEDAILRSMFLHESHG